MKLLKYLVIASFIALCGLSTTNVSAQNIEPYKLLAPIPLNGDINNVPPPDQSTTLEEYLPAIIKLIIGLAGILAVIMIIYGGLNIMTGGDNASTRDNAKKIIQNALSGLLLIITAWLILNTISPGLVKFNLRFEALNITDGELGTNLGNQIPDGTYTGGSADILSCTDCIAVNAFKFGVKPPGTVSGSSGCTPLAGPSCLINKQVGTKLQTIYDRTTLTGPTWQVTEMFPPTAVHAEACEMPNHPGVSGTCVDVAIRGILPSSLLQTDTNRDAGSIAKFITEANKGDVGLCVIYEVPNQTRKDKLTKATPPVPAKSIIVVPDRGAPYKPIVEHFSVYLDKSKCS